MGLIDTGARGRRKQGGAVDDSARSAWLRSDSAMRDGVHARAGVVPERELIDGNPSKNAARPRTVLSQPFTPTGGKVTLLAPRARLHLLAQSDWVPIRVGDSGD